VHRAEVTGADAYLHLRVNGSVLVVRHPAATRPATGDEVRISPGTGWHVFDAETGARV
jgi:hypothetical protein